MTTESATLEEIIEQRKEKLNWLVEQGISPYPSAFEVEFLISDLSKEIENIIKDEPERKVVIAGRIMTMRLMGKACFCHIQDSSGKMQVYLREDMLGEDAYRIFKKGIDIGDWIGVEGKCFKTRTGEITINVSKINLLSKSLRPLPEKWHGLKDVEIRYRQRYIDLIVNNHVKEIFITRSKIVDSLRKTLMSLDFIEVETPQMQAIPGGAIARPFKTFHNSLDMQLFLRIAPELYLKRLIVGGFERVFEIGRCFRNEGIDSRHNPEFTILEAYKAWADYEGIMKLTEELFAKLAEDLKISDKLKYRGKEFSIKTPFKKVSILELFERYVGEKLELPPNKDKLIKIAKKHNLTLEEDISVLKIYDRIFDALITPNLVDPTFVIDYPKMFSPLAKSKEGEKEVAERFELFIAGEEIANAYSELNDPMEQSKLFKQQLENKNEDEKLNAYDYDYIRALEYGMPPTGGLGIGIDRLVMIITGIESIREVVFFPLLRQEK
ncbi:MAG: lysine--tRNA ligase [bacterium]